MSADQELSGFDGDEGNTVVGDTTLPPSDSDTAEIVRGDPADRDDWTRNAAAENDGGGADPVDRTDSPDPISEAIENFGNTAANLQRFYQERLDNIRIREAERTDEFEAKMDELLKQERELLDSLKDQQDQLDTDKATFEEQKASLSGTHKFTKQKVKLDVGGERFTSSRSTLVSDKSSFLAAMLSGRYELHADASDGSYFIDRDGSQFGHLVNFLRGEDSFEPPKKMQELQQLRADAVFFKLNKLIAILDKAIAVS